MSLSDPKIIRALRKHFVLGWRNIDGVEPYAGKSGTHLPDFPAAKTTTCAGHHNVQMFFMTPDGRVLHALPGYWGPEALLCEIELAVALSEVYFNDKLSTAEKYEKFLDAQLMHVLHHERGLTRESELQSFDRRKMDQEGSDFRREEGLHTCKLKTTDQVMHERMAERPFLPYEEFDTATFIDMGVKSFDAHCDGCNDPRHQKKIEEYERRKKAALTPKGESKKRDRKRPTTRPTTRPVRS